MNVLVTGGAGYVGSHVCKALHGAGHRVVVLDNLSRGNRWAVRWGPLEVCGIQDGAAVGTVLRRRKIDAVVHLAAYAYVGESMARPELYYQNNTAGSLSLLNAVLDYGAAMFVFASSCATYGDPQWLPIDESHSLSPTSPYGHSKLVVEQALEWYGRIHGLQWVALRYFNAAGADPEGEIGEHHVPETHLVPLALEAVVDADKALSVFGTDHRTPDGTAVRDYVHVTDLARAHVQALEWLASGGDSTVFNLGAVAGHSVRQVVAAVEDVTGRRVALRLEPRRPGDPAGLIADASRARAHLRWTPQLSSLPQIIETAWKWRINRSQSRAASA